jgi:TfoX/Sxy family transcriptional regulator of competence genes
VPYNEDLAARVRAAFARRKNITEKKMFGGVGWLLNGNMCVGVWKEWFIARLGADYSLALREPHVREFDITGKSLTGWVMIGLPALATDEALREWVNRCIAFVRTLPAKA